MFLPSHFLLPLAQISDKALSAGEPRLDTEPSSALTLLLGTLFVVLILFIAFKTSKRNQAQE